MEQKRANTAFTTIILFSMAIEFLILFFFYDKIDKKYFEIYELFFEVLYLIPAFAVIFIFRDKSEPLWSQLGYRKIRVTTVLMVILYSILLLPIGNLASSISMVFTENIVVTGSEVLLKQPFWISFLGVAIIPPLIEEFIFRGIVYKGYRSSGRRRAAVFLSAFLFGLFHMNLNQFIYAFIIGILLALVVEATGSIWSSVICHLIFNAESVITMYLTEYLYPGYLESYEFGSDGMGDTIVWYAIVAVIAFIILVFVLKGMSANEDREEELKELFFPTYSEGRKARLATPILWVGIVVSVLWIIFFEFISVLNRMYS